VGNTRNDTIGHSPAHHEIEAVRALGRMRQQLFTSIPSFAHGFTCLCLENLQDISLPVSNFFTIAVSDLVMWDEPSGLDARRNARLELAIRSLD
jgi:hypothetical protein